MEFLMGLIYGLVLGSGAAFFLTVRTVEDIVDIYSDPFIVKYKVGTETIKKTYKVVEVKE